jgi:hypothetical protein
MNNNNNELIINHATTCHNYSCDKYATCTHNVWNDGLQCKLKQYMSARQSAFKAYEAKGGTLSYNEYNFC